VRSDRKLVAVVIEDHFVIASSSRAFEEIEMALAVGREWDPIPIRGVEQPGSSSVRTQRA
jgi:hypothetical protein